MSLKQRLLFFVAILLAIAIAVLSALAYQRMRSEIIHGVQQELDAAIAGNGEALGRWLAQRRDAIQATANRLGDVDASAPYQFLQQGKDAVGFDQTFAGYADKAMRYHTPDKLAADGKTLDEQEADAIRAPVIAQYECQGHPYYASARLWDDGIIDPADTRRVVGLGLSAALNADAGIHGILVQLPLPKHIDTGKVIQAIAPDKDVDGFHVINAGRLAVGQEGFVPCTPLGCLMLLQDHHCV